MKAIGHGNLVRDPELKKVGDTSVCRFSLAITKKRKGKNGENQDQVSFLDFEVWDTAAEILNKYGKKGRRIYVEAEPRQDKWEKDGEKRSAVIFRVEKFDFLDRVENPTQDEQPQQQQEQPQQSKKDEEEVVPF